MNIQDISLMAEGKRILVKVHQLVPDALSIEYRGGFPVVSTVNELLAVGLELGASDIHLEPMENYFRIRYRIDGVLVEIYRLPLEALPSINSRIKLMAGMDIAEKRLPQDGRMQINIREQKIDFRVSSLPTIAGEKIVLRILVQNTRITSLEQLGLGGDQLKQFKKLLCFPNGIFMVTGPTGSGKTTTLYASLAQLMTEQQNIMTIEDPVEYVIDGLNQVQINTKAQLDFALGLKSILRQDPDILMIGEIRDRETAEIAIRAATTGHLVLTTMHTNDAVSSLTRLVEMGVENYFVASAVIGVVAQRLIRTICQSCIYTYELEKDSWEYAVLAPYLKSWNSHSMIRLSRGRGCIQCNYTGYKGREAIGEILIVNDALRRGLLGKLDNHQLKEIGIQHKMLTLRSDGLRKVFLGRTTIEEVMRVTYDGKISGVNNG